MNNLSEWIDWIIVSLTCALGLSMGLLAVYQNYKANKIKRHPRNKAKFVVDQDRNRLAWDEKMRQYRR